MTIKHNSAEIPCDITVAYAAPAVPVLTTTIKNISKALKTKNLLSLQDN